MNREIYEYIETSDVFPASLVWPAILQIRALALLRRVENILPEEAFAIGGYIELHLLGAFLVNGVALSSAINRFTHKF